MNILSVNISGAKQADYNGRVVGTGIYKEPVAGPVQAGKLTLEGDRQVDHRYHGGEHKAVYAYPYEHYSYWAEQLGRDDFSYGQFGENFTTEGVLETDVHIGDRFRIGEALVEVTQPRVPCFKLGMKMEDPRFVQVFLRSGLSGFYLRVLEEGQVEAGNAIEREFTHPEKITVRAIHHLYFNDSTNREEIKRALSVEALSKEWRKQLMEL